MEPQGLVSDASWSFFDPSMAVQESDVMVHLFGPHQYLNGQDQENSGIGVQPVFWSDHSADGSCYSEKTNYNPCYWSQGNWSDGATSDNASFLHSFSNSSDFYLNDANVNFSIADEQTTQMSIPPSQAGSGHRLMEAVVNDETSSDEIAESMEPASVLLDHSLQSMKRRLHPDDAEKPAAQAEGDDNQPGSSKKKARASAQVPKKGKNTQSKRQQKSASGSNEAADSKSDMNAQSSSCYSSEDDDSNAQNGAGATTSSSKGSNPNGKARAGRGSATDPQSLYARKRRERINERLRILQNLVPNGTKVDISTMLEEAVQYVKFLQLQIKLLSSDELWMYAPIAYNGMNLAIDLRISAPSPACKRI